MRVIPVGHLEAKVDDEIYEELINIRWHITKGRNTFYAATNKKEGVRKYRTLFMHSIINKTPKGMLTDHIDGDGLNNQKNNLRSATHRQNSRNKAPNRNSSSKYKGVYWDKQKSKWKASIRIDGKLISLGFFEKEIDASIVYEERAKEEFKEFYRRSK